ncbi:MAG: TRAP transporter substrate-binding protein [Spirochaetota bacterium]
MRKFGLVVLVLALVVMTASANGTAEEGQRIVLEAGTFHPPGTGDVESLQYFKEFVEKQSNGEITVNVSFGETLGTELDTVEQTRLGTLQVVIDGLGTMGLYGKQFASWTVPYAYPDVSSLVASAKGPIGKAMSKRMEADGVLFGGLIPMGFRHMTANVPAVEPSDLKGIKLRLPNNRSWITVWEKFGVIPTPIPAPEMYLALQTGLVDAQENPYTTIHVRKLWEVQKYVIETSHLADFRILVINKAFVDGLSEKHRKIVMEGVDAAIAWQTEFVEDLQEKYKKEAMDNGMQIIQPNTQAYRQMAMSAWSALAKDWEPWVYDQMIKETTR